MRHRLLRRWGADGVRRASWVAIALTLLAIVASFVVRGPAAGADFEVYWVAARTWLAGGDPYDLPAGVLPYVYAPWGLPLFVPWALLPWDLAFSLWRVMILGGLVVSLAWAARRRPAATAVVFIALAVPIGINLDTGNITLPAALAIFGARFAPPWVAGAMWGAVTGLKWASLPLLLVLGVESRRIGLATLAIAAALSLALWPMTAAQLHTIANLERPFPIDYFVLIWAVIPWLWTDPERRRWLDPAAWVRRGSVVVRLGRRRWHRLADGRDADSN